MWLGRWNTPPITLTIALLVPVSIFWTVRGSTHETSWKVWCPTGGASSRHFSLQICANSNQTSAYPSIFSNALISLSMNTRSLKVSWITKPVAMAWTTQQPLATTCCRSQAILRVSLLTWVAFHNHSTKMQQPFKHKTLAAWSMLRTRAGLSMPLTCPCLLSSTPTSNINRIHPIRSIINIRWARMKVIRYTTAPCFHRLLRNWHWCSSACNGDRWKNQRDRASQSIYEKRRKAA